MYRSPSQEPCGDAYLCDFMMGLSSKPNLCTKFEIASFSLCRNITEEPPNFGELPWHTTTSNLVCQYDFAMALANPNCVPNMNSLALAIAEILKGNHKDLGATLAQRHAHILFYVRFMMGLGKPQLNANFEVSSFSRCRNIKGELSNCWELS